MAELSTNQAFAERATGLVAVWSFLMVILYWMTARRFVHQPIEA